MPLLAHAQQDRDRDRDRAAYNNAYVAQDRDHDRDRDNDRDRFRANDGAYQDGWSHGMQDGQKRHKSKIKYGHWKNRQDREAFAEGYNRGYQSYYANNNNDRHDRDHDHR